MTEASNPIIKKINKVFSIFNKVEYLNDKSQITETKSRGMNVSWRKYN